MFIIRTKVWTASQTFVSGIIIVQKGPVWFCCNACFKARKIVFRIGWGIVQNRS